MMIAGASALASGSTSVVRAQTTAPYKYKLRYAPRIGLLQGLTVPQQLEVYAKNGFLQFEFNGLPSQSPAEIKAIRIDKLRRMADVAAKRNREGLPRCAVSALSARDASGDPQIGSPVRHAGHLCQDVIRLSECFIDVPQRTGAAEA